MCVSLTIQSAAADATAAIIFGAGATFGSWDVIKQLFALLLKHYTS